MIQELPTEKTTNFAKVVRKMSLECEIFYPRKCTNGCISIKPTKLM